MDFLIKTLAFLNKNVYTFLITILIFILFIYSIFIILDIKNINPFLYFQF